MVSVILSTLPFFLPTWSITDHQQGFCIQPIDLGNVPA
jgi:hypothetical protein